MEQAEMNAIALVSLFSAAVLGREAAFIRPAKRGGGGICFELFARRALLIGGGKAGWVGVRRQGGEALF